MTDTPRFVVLFDIDGTLVTGPAEGHTAGAISILRAAEEISGRTPDLPLSEFAGRTDPQIARLLLESTGENDPPLGRVQELVRRYVHYLRSEVQSRPYRALGDAPAAVATLRERGARIGLGTGNVPEGSAIKLESAGIARLFEGFVGGFGDDGTIRAELLEAGARRLDPERTLPVVVIGDTPRDISAAKAISAISVGVPYRSNTRSVLEDAGADAIIDAVGADLGPLVETLIA